VGMDNKTLVIYYTTFGSTGKVAHIIADKLQCEIKEIELVKPYSKVSSVTFGVVDSLRQKMPEIKNKILIDDYDTIYIGAPIWGYTVSIILKSFLKDMDFAGKKVVPFCTDDGNKGDYNEKMQELCKNADSFGECIEIQFSRKKSYEQLKKEVDQIME
jgi:Flavodoxin